jgi:hypothetical protein
LAGEAAGEDVDGLHLLPVDAGDVAEVGQVGPVVGEDFTGAGVDVGHPHGFGAEEGIDGQVQARIPAEE